MGGKSVIRNYDSKGNLISKKCCHCHKIKPVSEFYKNNKKKIDGLNSQCKECDSKRYQKKRKQIVRNYDNRGNLISKECTCCHEVKPVSEFGKRERSKDGLESQCKECRKIYREENKDKFNEYNKKYKQENPDYFKKYNKKYKQENKDKTQKYNKKYKDKKTQDALQQNKKEIETNPEKYNYNGDKKPFGIIYSVHNIKSNKYYVGQTKTTFDIRYPSGWLYKHGRKKEVKEDLELYGENSFEYNKLLDVAYSQYELDKLEAYYIDYYDSYENGYNGNRGNIFTNRGKEI